MDLPAYGLTGAFPNRNYSMKNYTNFLNSFLKKIGVKKCILAGNSLGGQIAWNFCLEQPKMVEKLILIDAAGYPLKSKSVPIAFKLAKAPIVNKLFTFVTPRFLVKSSIKNVYFDTAKVTDKLIDRYFELTLRKGNRQAFIDRFNMFIKANSYTKINLIKQPTLILWGANDLLIPVSNAYKFQKDLSNNTLTILKNTGHTPMEENPTESLKPVFQFIKNGQ
ncbi:alpha/beta fold hydrolase [Tenacibaculum sp. Bg11-29]|uniref:alpha/beta fold hydrolase n=1 Tax=Tenacibaculum sp. Bg11-29 TaxID=2058306 RepID=UPI001E2884AA|nr:alpha/beta hydrolase [Tenacibaculum sp. Bg11-29]